MNYIFFYSDNPKLVESLENNLPLKEYKINLINMTSINLPDDCTSAYVFGQTLVQSRVLMDKINGARIFIGPELKELASKEVRNKVLEDIKQFFCLNFLEQVEIAESLINKFEEAGARLIIRGEERDLIVGEDITYEEFKGLLYLTKYLGIYQVSINYGSKQ